MPEVEKIKSESEKMVPIDTSGDSIDVELKEEKKEEDELVIEDTKEEKSLETKEDHKEEEEYSQSVKKRIDKLTFKLREADRQRGRSFKICSLN